MKRLSIGIQLYGLRSFAEADLFSTLQAVKNMGYDGVELAGFYGKSGAEMHEILERFGLRAISAHVPFQLLRTDMQHSLEQCVAAGCRYVAVPSVTPENRYPNKQFYNVVEEVYHIGQKAMENGLQLLYHNHDFEFQRMPDGQYVLDYIYEQIPSELLQTELDLCWVKVSGEEPVNYLQKYSGRCPIVHFKDFYKEGSPVQFYGPGREEHNRGKGTFEFRPVGSGQQLWQPILLQTIHSGAEWIIVEQDESKDCLMDADSSIRYLKTLYSQILDDHGGK